MIVSTNNCVRVTVISPNLKQEKLETT